MNKTKYMLAGFAVFASILMLTTTCIARPVQEKTNIDAVESAQAELMNSIEALFLKMKNDRYLNSLKDQFSKDRTLNSIASAIENTEDFDAKASLASSYVDALKNNQVFNNLAAYFESTYSGDLQKLSDVFGAYQSVNTETEDFEIVGAIPYPGGSPWNDDDSDDTIIGGSGIDGAYSSGKLTLTSDNSYTPPTPDSDMGFSCGFVINMNGEMYIPGMGWVDAEEYGWLNDLMQSLTIGEANELLEQLENMGPQPTCILAILMLIYLILEVFVQILAEIISMIEAFLSEAAGFLAELIVAISFFAFLWLATLMSLIEAIMNLIEAILDLIFGGGP